MIDFFNKFEKIVVVCLLCMMAIVVLLSTIELGLMIIKGIITPPIVLVEDKKLLQIFAYFLYVLIGFELLESIKAYLKEKVFHLEIIFKVALIALARKIIILDLEKYDGFSIFGLACIILAVAAAFFVISKKTQDG